MPHAHDYPFDRRCGAHACIHCDDHRGLARCYCGWSHTPGAFVRHNILTNALRRSGGSLSNGSLSRPCSAVAQELQVETHLVARRGTSSHRSLFWKTSHVKVLSHNCAILVDAQNRRASDS